MRYKLVIFDFDGTLADSFSWMIGVFNQVADKYKFKRVSPGEIELLRSYDSKQMLKHLEVPLWKLPLIATHVRKLMAKDIQQVSLFDGVDGMLQRLKNEGMTLAIVSSNSEENIKQVLGPENSALITHYGCGAGLFGKPAKFRQVIRKSGLKRQETICIGDEVRDIQAAYREQVACGAVAWGYATPEVLKAHSPSEVFTSLDEIVTKLI